MAKKNKKKSGSPSKAGSPINGNEQKEAEISNGVSHVSNDEVDVTDEVQVDNGNSSVTEEETVVESKNSNSETDTESEQPIIPQDTQDTQDTVATKSISQTMKDSIEVNGDFIDNADSNSIQSTDAVLETSADQLNDITPSDRQEPTEQDLNPDLAKFMTSCQEGNLTLVKEMISSGKIKPNDTFSDGITGLHWACINNRLTLVKYLVENGSDPNFLGGELKASPLHWACRNGLVYICLLYTSRCV